METSAFQKINIDKAFLKMIEEIYKKYEKIYGEAAEEEEISQGQNDNLANENKNKEKKKKCC